MAGRLWGSRFQGKLVGKKVAGCSSMVTFKAPDCPTCHMQLPPFGTAEDLELLQQLRHGRLSSRGSGLSGLE